MARASSFLDRINSQRGVRASFVPRVAGVEVRVDKWETLAGLEPHHREAVRAEGFAWEQLWRAEQVHGEGVAVVPREEGLAERIVPGVDGLLTGEVGIALGIYVADCAAVFLADRVTGALGLIHSGRKGTELEIVVKAVERMGSEFGTQAGNLEAAISPCIRPPHYEVDIGPAIVAQLAGAGVPEEQIRWSGVCSGAEVGQYYSYRIEKGKTGRMLAILGRTSEDRAQS